MSSTAVTPGRVTDHGQGLTTVLQSIVALSRGTIADHRPRRENLLDVIVVSFDAMPRSRGVERCSQRPLR